ncbi:zinc finger BED domain-containing protein RICESLEEPER 2-like [Miscanthus floridulus]|uniref:zinc finger BED domain-containing protein RICESLEEPER 2-like n=1 Tax=Miscanthus floridulus TaxID=154761 RepID=UPI00345A958C
MVEDDGELPPGMAPEGENDDDIRDDAAALFGVDLGDGDGGEGATASANPVGSNSNGSVPSVAAAGNGKVGKRKSPVWDDFEEIFETMNGVQICTKAKCKMCKSTLSARSSAGTGHLKRHQNSCRQKTDQRDRVQSRLSYNPDGSVHNWDYKPEVARTELCILIARLDLPLGIGDTDAFEEYIQRAHNPRFRRVSRQSTTRDLRALFTERRNMLKNHVLSGASSVALTSDIWSGNAKEDYISVVAHYEFGMIDKIYSVTLDNASSNAKAMETLTPIIAMFKNYCNAQGVRPRKFGLDMDEVFSVFINAIFGCTLLTPRHWLIAAKILEFLELFYESTCVLSDVYYPTSPLILHHMLDIAHHLHESEKDQNLMAVVYPMKLKYLKYWENIPLLYSIAFILDPRAKLRGLFNVLVILKENIGVDYNKYYADVKTEIYKLFAKYDSKYGSTRSQRPVHPAVNSGKRKQAWGRIFGGPGSSAVVGHPPPASVSTSTQSAASVACELTTYLDSDNVTAYEDDFDLLLWWRDHKLTYPVLSIMARDIMAVPVSTVSSESCFSLTGRIIEERRRRLLPEHVEMLACIKDWELGDRRLQHSTDNQELAESFENLYLDVPEDGSGPPSASTSASASVASASAAT